MCPDETGQDPATARLRRGMLLYVQDLWRAGVQHVVFPAPLPGEVAPLIENLATEGQPELPAASGCGQERLPSDTERASPIVETGTKESMQSAISTTDSNKAIPSKESVEPVTLTVTKGALPLMEREFMPPPSVELPTGATREEVLAELARRVAQCTRCPELVNNRTQTVFGVGNPYAELVFIGEAPGVDEDIQGQPFVGRAGQLLTAMITNGMGMKREDVYICNILRCRPPNNRTPTRDEAINCRPWLDATLAVIQPKFICCLGSVAAQNLLGTETPIGRLRGKVWEYRGAKVICTYHPAFLLRNPAMKREAWEDLKLLLQIMGRPVPRRSTPGQDK